MFVQAHPNIHVRVYMCNEREARNYHYNNVCTNMYMYMLSVLCCFALIVVCLTLLLPSFSSLIKTYIHVYTYTHCGREECRIIHVYIHNVCVQYYSSVMALVRLKVFH